MGPLTNPGKICLSKVWKLQKYLQRRQIQCRFDFKEKGRYKPLSNQRDAKPKDWSSLQKVWPSINWDNDLRSIKLDALPDDDKNEAYKLIEEINANWDIFQSNMKEISTKRILKNPISKETKQVSETLLIIMSDATGGVKYSIVGAVAYLCHTYQDNTFGWVMVAASSKLADEGLTIVAKELKAAKLATDLAKKVSKNLQIPKHQIYLYVDNTVILDQIEGCREKGI